MARDPYQELGVPRGAGEDEIRKAFRNLAKKHHPDANPGDKAAEERFKRVSAAFDILGDPDKRKKFDAGEIDADEFIELIARLAENFFDVYFTAIANAESARLHRVSHPGENVLALAPAPRAPAVGLAVGARLPLDLGAPNRLELDQRAWLQR